MKTYMTAGALRLYFIGWVTENEKICAVVFGSGCVALLSLQCAIISSCSMWCRNEWEMKLMAEHSPTSRPNSVYGENHSNRIQIRKEHEHDTKQHSGWFHYRLATNLSHLFRRRLAMRMSFLWWKQQS